MRVLSLSDEVYSDVTEYLGVKPRHCPIVLNPGTDVFNGFYQPFPNRISLHETPLFTIKGFGPGSDLMDGVYTHEFAHYVHVTTRLGWYGELCHVLGDGLALANAISPGWIIEGITTNAETMFTDGGRGRSPLFRGTMMSFTEGEGMWSLSAAGTSPPYSPPSQRIYLSGYHMVEYMNRTYGEDAFSRLSRYQAKHPLGGTRRALKFATGKTPREFYSEFLWDFEQRAKQTRDSILKEGLPAGRTILSESVDTFISHFWTERGTIQVLRAGYVNPTAIVEVDPQSGEKVQEIRTGILNSFFPVRRIPEGRLIFGEVFVHPLNGTGIGASLDTADLVVFDLKEQTHMRLTRGEHIYSADLSPDGTVFVAARRNGMWIDLVLVERDGSRIRPLVSKPGVYLEAPVWSPDGSCIAAAVKVGQNADIVIIDPHTGSMNTLFQTDIHGDNEPCFSPDGRWIVFSSNRSGIWNIHAWDMAEHKLYQITSVFYAASGPHISPDGETLSFFSMHRGVNRLCTMPFMPRAGKEVHVEDGSILNEPDLERLEPEISFQESGIPWWKVYRPFLHVPYLSSDEDGATFGIFVMGADPVGINSYTANIFHGLESNRPGYDLWLTNRSFWPTIRVRAYDSAQEGNTLGGGRDYWFRERGGELSFGLDVTHKTAPSIISSSYRAGTRIRKFDGLEGLSVDSNQDRSMGVFGEMVFSRTPDHARRDVVPLWGQQFFISHEEGVSDMWGELPGHNTFASVTQYVPSVLKHHGFEITVSHQSQDGILFYEKSSSIPRGYDDDDEQGGLNLRKNLLTSMEYHFPIWYADRGIGLSAFHLNLFKGSLFVDYGAGWEDDFVFHDWTDQARTTVGATLTARSYLLAWIPVEIGLSGGYKIREEEAFINFIFQIIF